MFCWYTAIIAETRSKYQVLECFAWFIQANSVLSYLALHKECFKQVVSGFLLNNSRIAPFQIDIENFQNKTVKHKILISLPIIILASSKSKI